MKHTGSYGRYFWKGCVLQLLQLNGKMCFYVMQINTGVHHHNTTKDKTTQYKNTNQDNMEQYKRKELMMI